MNLLDTSQIPRFPKNIFVGWSKVNFELDVKILPERDLIAIQSFTNEQRKAEFLTARHLFLKLITELGWNFDLVDLKKEEMGKPFIKTQNGRKFVSFSHSQDLVLCAVSDTLDIGLDTETIDRELNPAIVKRILSENEWKIYGDDEPLSLWTMKEAAVKCLGTGLRTNLKELELEKLPNGRFTIRINGKEELKGIYFQALNHYISIAY